MQLELFDFEDNNLVRLDELFAAYFDCRHNKRKTFNALEFEGDYESRLVDLWREINDGTYYPGRSIAFIVDKPVKREIFAADFRDRIVHHLVVNKILPLLETLFINDSFSCREGKGTQHGVNRIAQFVRECSENYTKDCYILKMDIQSFFMTIDKRILNQRLQKFIKEYYHAVDKKIIMKLVEIIIFHCPQFDCLIKGKKSDWNGLPHSKSLFYAGKYKGLPIGNLSSQIFANFYMDFFDKYVKYDLGIKYYGRYVDDFVIVHEDKNFLIEIQKKMRAFMKKELHLKLHPKKIYLQHYSKGVKFIGAVVKPGRNYVANRTKGNFYEKLQELNALAQNDPNYAEQAEHFVASVNSYLGFMMHYSSYKIRHKMIWNNIDPKWWDLVYTYSDAKKLVLKKEYTSNVKYMKKVRELKRSVVEDNTEQEALF